MGKEQKREQHTRAARAVAIAVYNKEGRRPMIKWWRPIAAKALGFSRLGSSRWQQVVDAGVEAGFFRVCHRTLRYPILVADSLPHEPGPAIEDEDTDDEATEPVAAVVQMTKGGLIGVLVKQPANHADHWRGWHLFIDEFFDSAAKVEQAIKLATRHGGCVQLVWCEGSLVRARKDRGAA